MYRGMRRMGVVPVGAQTPVKAKGQLAKNTSKQNPNAKVRKKRG